MVQLGGPGADVNDIQPGPGTDIECDLEWCHARTLYRKDGRLSSRPDSILPPRKKTRAVRLVDDGRARESFRPYRRRMTIRAPCG